MAGANPKPVESNQPMLKMKQLAAATGVPKSTILLYVSKGLLPKPVKTSPNMAYYDPVCIERIRFIKQAQARHRLPLAAIKGLIKELEKGRDIQPLLELQSLIFGASGKKMDKAAFCKAARLTEEQVDQLCRRRLLIATEDGVFDEQDLGIALLFEKGLALGLNMDDLLFYPDLAGQMVDREITLREKYTRGLTFRENAALTLELTSIARGLRAYVIDRTLQKELIGFKGLKKT